MTCWVSTEILERKTPSQRATVIEHFIEIANACYKHNDLHCALNITIALGSACIRSLRLTWAEVNKKVSAERWVQHLDSGHVAEYLLLLTFPFSTSTGSRNWRTQWIITGDARRWERIWNSELIKFNIRGILCDPCSYLLVDLLKTPSTKLGKFSRNNAGCRSIKVLIFFIERYC